MAVSLPSAVMPGNLSKRVCPKVAASTYWWAWSLFRICSAIFWAHSKRRILSSVAIGTVPSFRCSFLVNARKRLAGLFRHASMWLSSPSVQLAFRTAKAHSFERTAPCTVVLKTLHLNLNFTFAFQNCPTTRHAFGIDSDLSLRRKPCSKLSGSRGSVLSFSTYLQESVAALLALLVPVPSVLSSTPLRGPRRHSLLAFDCALCPSSPSPCRPVHSRAPPRSESSEPHLQYGSPPAVAEVHCSLAAAPTVFLAALSAPPLDRRPKSLSACCTWSKSCGSFGITWHGGLTFCMAARPRGSAWQIPCRFVHAQACRDIFFPFCCLSMGQWSSSGECTQDTPHCRSEKSQI